MDSSIWFRARFIPVIELPIIMPPSGMRYWGLYIGFGLTTMIRKNARVKIVPITWARINVLLSPLFNYPFLFVTILKIAKNSITRTISAERIKDALSNM